MKDNKFLMATLAVVAGIALYDAFGKQLIAKVMGGFDGDTDLV